MKLYLLRGCPFAHRASIVLNEKHLAFEHVFFAPGQRPPELEALGPQAKSPTLIDGEVKVWDSQIVLEYLEDRAPEPALLPATAAGRAEARMLQARAAAELGAHQGTLVMETVIKPKEQRDPAKAEKARTDAVLAMAAWDRRLDGRPFLMGDAMSLADVTLFTIVDALARMNASVPSELTHLRAWYDRLAARPSTKPLA